MTERKWQMVKLGKGDWLLPSNDRKTLWRITTIVEGPSTGFDDMPRDKEFWAVWKWAGHSQFPRDEMDLEFDSWALMSSWHKTRREAIDEALGLGERV